jgi:NADPH2 dehydrogenase
MINRFTPFKFKNGKLLQNRVVIPPMASETADTNGFATQKTINHYERLSRSGASLVFVEYSFVHESGRGEQFQLGAHSDETVPGLSEIAEIIHRQSSFAGLQLVHVGGKAEASVGQQELMSPSGVRVPVIGWEPGLSREMNKKDIKNWVEWFVASARRAHVSGFDIVELHAAHGYGLNQWLSPLTNKRGDEYGGDITGRSKILFEIIEEIKKAVPQLLIAVRLPAQDHLEHGLCVEEMKWVVEQLEKIGVDLIDVSSGIGGWRRPEGKRGEGYLVDDAYLLREKISIPVIGVGGIETASFIDKTLQEKRIDFAAVGRAILKNPEEWGARNLRQ